MVLGRLMAASAVAPLFIAGDLALRTQKGSGRMQVCVYGEHACCPWVVATGRPVTGGRREEEAPRATDQSSFEEREVSKQETSTGQYTVHQSACRRPLEIPNALGGIGAVWGPERPGRRGRVRLR